MEAVSREAFQGRCRLVDERFERDQKRLEKLELGLERVSALSVQMGELLKQSASCQNDHKERLSRLESRPFVWLDRALSAAAGAVISTLVAVLGAGIF